MTGAHVTIDYAPRRAFMPFHERGRRNAILVCHRRAGKTVACINDLIMQCLTCTREMPRFAYIAPLRQQAKDIAWDYLKRFTADLQGRETNEAELRVDLPGGRRIRIYGADNPDALRGIYLDGAVIDEPAQMKPVLWSEVLPPALADRDGIATFIGTPKGQNWFYNLWRGAEGKGWFKMMLKASESGILTKAQYDSLIAEMPDPNKVEQEMECSFDVPDALQFISKEITDMARHRIVPRSTGARIMSVDVARFGDDRTVLMVRTDRLEEIKVFRGLDTMQTAGQTMDMARRIKPHAIFVDGNGVGGGVVDRLRMSGLKVFDVQAGGRAEDSVKYYNKRAEMWGRMREWTLTRGAFPVEVANLNELCDDMQTPRYMFDISNRIQLEAKEDMKKRGVPSPDLGDALAMSFAEAIIDPQVQAAWAGDPWEQQQQREFNPLEDF